MTSLLLLLLRGYGRWISPLFPRRCKFYPTCSGYAMTALRRYGFVRGMLLSVWRLLRCNPWSQGGLDFVPPTFRLSCTPNDTPPSPATEADREA